jgi:hypothetical protein
MESFNRSKDRRQQSALAVDDAPLQKIFFPHARFRLQLFGVHEYMYEHGTSARGLTMLALCSFAGC